MDLHKLIGQLFVEKIEMRMKITELEGKLMECEQWRNMATEPSTETVLSTESQ